MPVKFDNSIINQIQQATDIVDVISEHLSLQKKGKEMVGLCPFHEDHKPSMFVNPVKQIFKCFACGAGGDVFKFMQLRENLTFPQAIERLAQRAGIKLQQQQRRRKEEKSGKVDPKEVARINAWAQKLWKSNLFDEQKGAGVLEYLKDRQISSDSVKEWGIGFAVDSWDDLVARARNNKRISERLLIDAGLAVTRDDGSCYDKFRNRLMFPIIDVTGRAIGFGGRTLGDDEAKYMNTPATVLFDKSNSLYGLDKARHQIVSSGTVVVVEGYTDVIMAHQYGCDNVVATLGTSFTDGHARVLRRYAKRIVLVFDNDVAGVEAANRALEVCLSQKIDIKLTFVPEGKDPCDFLQTAGREAFEKVVDNAIDVMESKWQRLNEGLGSSDNLTDRRAATEEFLQSVARALRGGRLDPIARGLMITKLSGIIGLSSDQINRELQRLYGRISSTDSFAVRNQKVISVNMGDNFFAKAQREVLEVLLNEPELFDKVRGKITSEQFDEPVLHEIAKVVFDSLGNGKKATLAELLTRLESVEAGSAIVELAEVGEKKTNYTERLEKAVTVVEKYFEKDRISTLKAGLKDNETETLRKISEGLSRTNKRNPGMMTM